MKQTAAVVLADRSSASVSEIPVGNEAYASGVSWAAVIGGAFVSASLALIFLSLGAGFGFSAVSPWVNVGASAATVGGAAVAWLILTQIVAAAMGGYLAGRLRTKWIGVHIDEVYFRDTAHGFLAWAIGLVITAAFLTTAAVSLAGGATQRGGDETRAAAAAAEGMNPNAYFVETLLRSTSPVQNQGDVSERGVVTRILDRGLRDGAIPPAESAFLAQLVSARTGLSPSDAGKLVGDVFGQAQRSADRMRRKVAHLSLWLFVALLSGAFCASYAGTIGGKQRDRVLV